MILPVGQTQTQVQVTPPEMDKLKKGSREFEAMLIQQLWKGLREESSDESGSSQTLTDVGMQAMASGLAARGGIGIAKTILSQFALKGS